MCKFAVDHKVVKVKTQITAFPMTNAPKLFHIASWFAKLTQRFTERY